MKKSVFLTGITTLYKKSEADVADHLKTVEGEDIDDALALTIFKQLDAEKVSTMTETAKTRFNDGVGKGQKDTARKFEKSLREVFNTDEALEGDDLLAHIKAEVPKLGKPGENTADLSKLTEDDLLKVPVYINK